MAGYTNPYMSAMTQGGALANQTAQTASSFGQNAIKGFDSSASIALKLDQLLMEEENHRDKMLMESQKQLADSVYKQQALALDTYKANSQVDYQNKSLDITSKHYDDTAKYQQDALNETILHNRATEDNQLAATNATAGYYNKAGAKLDWEKQTTIAELNGSIAAAEEALKTGGYKVFKQGALGNVEDVDASTQEQKKLSAALEGLKIRRSSLGQPATTAPSLSNPFNQTGQSPVPQQSTYSAPAQTSSNPLASSVQQQPQDDFSAATDIRKTKWNELGSEAQRLFLSSGINEGMLTDIGFNKDKYVNLKVSDLNYESMYKLGLAKTPETLDLGDKVRLFSEHLNGKKKLETTTVQKMTSTMSPKEHSDSLSSFIASNQVTKDNYKDVLETFHSANSNIKEKITNKFTNAKSFENVMSGFSDDKFRAISSDAKLYEIMTLNKDYDPTATRKLLANASSNEYRASGGSFINGGIKAVQEASLSTVREWVGKNYDASASASISGVIIDNKELVKQLGWEDALSSAYNPFKTSEERMAYRRKMPPGSSESEESHYNRNNFHKNAKSMIAQTVGSVEGKTLFENLIQASAYTYDSIDTLTPSFGGKYTLNVPFSKADGSKGVKQIDLSQKEIKAFASIYGVAAIKAANDRTQNPEDERFAQSIVSGIGDMLFGKK